MQIIPHNTPCTDQEEVRAVSGSILSRQIAMGKEVEQLEADFARYCQRRYAVAVNSGLSALHLALLSLGVGRGDEVIIPTYTCVALLHAVHYTGATPIIVDVTEESLSPAFDTIQRHTTARTKAIILPHTFGFPAAVSEIQSLRIPIIEDCAQAIGTIVQQRPAGSYGSIGVFSFYATKVITSGQGGMLVTDDHEIYAYLTDAVRHDQRSDYRIRYNYQLTDMAAAMVRSQFRKLPDFLNRRRMIHRTYTDAVRSRTDITLLPLPHDSEANRFRILLRFQSAKERNSAQAFLESHGIRTIIPIQTYQLLHRLAKEPISRFPNAERYARLLLSLPAYPCLRSQEVHRITAALRKIPNDDYARAPRNDSLRVVRRTVS